MSHEVKGTKPLQPQFVNQKSFYGKAVVETVVTDDVTLFKLYSYDKYVAFVAVPKGDGKKFSYVFDTYSNTTLKHIKEFLMQHNMEAKNKAQIMRDYHDRYLPETDNA